MTRAILLALFLATGILLAEPILVRHREGMVHGFLALRTLEGKSIAGGDLVQTPDGDRITTRLIFRFKDGSIDDETTVYSQRKVFRLLSDHHIQQGPSFPHPIDITIKAAAGDVTVHYLDPEGKDRISTDHFDLPSDLANGLILTLLKNIAPKAPETKVSFLAPGGLKPTLVKLSISPGSKEKFSLDGSSRTAIWFVIRVELEGVSALLTSIVGKQPPEYYVWMIEGEAPAFLKTQGPAYADGPTWVTELIGPTWPAE